jgi:hypothetical protein
MAALPKANATQLLVDDRNPAIAYLSSSTSSNWWLGSTCADAAAIYNGTTAGTAIRGATAAYNFNGTSIAVYGTVAPSSPWTASYNVDDLQPKYYAAQSLPGSASNQLFFQVRIAFDCLR